MIKIVSLGTALAPLELSQEDALVFALARIEMRKGTRALYEKVFKNTSIQTRRFALERLEDVLEEDPDKLNRRFEKQAVALSKESLGNALRRAGLDPRDVDYLAVSTCTGYLCPGLAAYVIEAAGLRRDVRYADLAGMGCGSALPALEQAHNFLKANPRSVAASISTEICSAAMVAGDDPELVISNAIFGDGSAAAVLKDSEGGIASFRAFSSLTYPEWRETLRFRTDQGRLRNVLGKGVPAQSAESVQALARKLLLEQKLDVSDIRWWIVHAGGEKVLETVRKALALTGSDLESSRYILKRYGNLSSPTVLYTLDHLLGTPAPAPAPAPGELGMILAFGAGFSAHAALIEF